MRRWFPLFVLLWFASFGIAQAQPIGPNLLVYNVWVRPTAAAPAEGATPEPPLPGTVTSAYMTIENVSDKDYQLVGIEADFAEMSMIHETTIDDAGVARMRMVGRLDIPAGETVQLAPAGYHAMLMNVTRDLYANEAEKLVLSFKDSDGLTFRVPFGALVTDLPPKETSMVAANTIAMSFARDYMQITVILDNRDTQTDTLISVESPLGKVVILDKTIRFTDPFTPVEIPITEQTPFETGWLLMALRNFLPPPEAFPLTLTFESGKVITVAVPVLIGY